MPAPSSSLISAVLGDLAGLPEADRDALADKIPQLIAHLAWVPEEWAEAAKYYGPKSSDLKTLIVPVTGCKRP